MKSDFPVVQALSHFSSLIDAIDEQHFVSKMPLEAHKRSAFSDVRMTVDLRCAFCRVGKGDYLAALHEMRLRYLVNLALLGLDGHAIVWSKSAPAVLDFVKRRKKSNKATLVDGRIYGNMS